MIGKEMLSHSPRQTVVLEGANKHQESRRGTVLCRDWLLQATPWIDFNDIPLQPPSKASKHQCPRPHVNSNLPPPIELTHLNYQRPHDLLRWLSCQRIKCRRARKRSPHSRRGQRCIFSADSSVTTSPFFLSYTLIVLIWSINFRSATKARLARWYSHIAAPPCKTL